MGASFSGSNRAKWPGCGSAIIKPAELESGASSTPAQRAELDWLLYNKPLEYAQLVLGGEIEHYLLLGCDHGRLED